MRLQLCQSSYLLYNGPTRKECIPENIRNFNKIGQTFGWLTDNTYIVEFENNIEIMLTGVVHLSTFNTPSSCRINKKAKHLIFWVLRLFL
ncbi:hypothetical protein [Rufibacter roseus]|uniref:Uncharacterized protein n=1 Tax=Rufibacter roseus TaxID=1567108 RepID=A0ABW2DNR2_9BACT|nr:hypothetical protein [Rufibacter roseus]